MVDIFHEDTNDLALDPVEIEDWLNKVCVAEDKELGDLNIIFCSDNYLLDLNIKHLEHDYYTDIITFDYSEETVSGDLFISVDRVKDNAISYNVSFSEELNRVIAHGVLHLIGYGDKSESEAATMRIKESEALKLIVPRET